MKLAKLYRAAVEHGMSVDPRGVRRVRAGLERAKKDLADLKKDERDRFDHEQRHGQLQPDGELDALVSDAEQVISKEHMIWYGRGELS